MIITCPRRSVSTKPMVTIFSLRDSADNAPGAAAVLQRWAMSSAPSVKTPSAAVLGAPARSGRSSMAGILQFFRSVSVRNYGDPIAADPPGAWGLGKPDRTVWPTPRLSGAGTAGPTYDDGVPQAPPHPAP